ncbi:MAG: hypothetical protein D3908_11245 [Candidatus Electrothrix sp. AUS4]|nr:hypothetical protein [Candidatus Electrothrix sp. AUS4]
MPINETEHLTNDKADQSLQPDNQEQNISRRTIIKKIAVGSAALAGCSILPEKWTAPVMEFGALPAHAVTSGELIEALEAITSQAEATTASQGTTTTTTQETQPTSSTGSGKFSLVFYQTVMACASCGIWFDSAKLVIEHSNGTFTSSQSGNLLIKKARGPGYFHANISSIPANATIRRPL